METYFLFSFGTFYDFIDKRKVPGGDGNLEIQQCRKKTKKDMFIVCWTWTLESEVLICINGHPIVIVDAHLK